MRSEFITTGGKIVLERDTLFIRNINTGFHHTLAYELAMPLVYMVVAIFRLCTVETPFDYVAGAVFVILAIGHSRPLYDVLFLRSLSNRIPLKRIRSFELIDNDALHTTMVLKLQNGRYKKISFRLLEEQYQPLAELLSQHVHQTQSA